MDVLRDYPYSVAHMSDTEFVRHMPCNQCGSSDANSLYSDGSTFVLDVMPIRMATMTLFTLIACQMYDYKDQPDGCNPEESLKRQPNCSKHTKMERSYATIITTALERLSEQK